jgi:hypothetical protein
MHVRDALACVNFFPHLEILRVPTWILLTKCIRALEGGGQPQDCVAEKGVHSLGLCRLGRRELVYFGLLCVL